MKRILLLSGYDAASHRYWRELLEQQMPEYAWTQLAMPDRHFAWRVRGNSLGFAYQHADILHQDYDLLIVTSMVDLSSLIGFCPGLATIPTIVYFHENQFSYPVDKSQANLVNIQLTSIYTALCADVILFNSRYNKNTFLDGSRTLLDRLPDEVPAGLIDTIESITEVLPVPLNSDVNDNAMAPATRNPVPEIVWNHRWEYDKQPDVFFAAMTYLQEQNIAFKLHVLGQSFRKSPDCFAMAKQSFANELITWGYQPRDKYLSVLAQADIVVSSSLHEFQGLSMQEAISLNCIPVAPDRVVYPEYINAHYLYAEDDDKNIEASHLGDKILKVLTTSKADISNLDDYQLTQLIPRYRACFNRLI